MFADFNANLYFNDKLPVDTFNPPESLEQAKITPAEVQKVLEMHYPANRSTGLSNLPTQ